MTASQDVQELQKALRLHQSGDLNGAAALYRQLIKRNPNNFPALHFLGLMEASAGKFDQAKNLLARSLSIDPPNPQFAENYASVLFQAKDYEAAEQFSRQWLKPNGNSLSLLYVSAISLFKLGRLEEALQQFDKVLALHPNHIAALNERGSVLAALKRTEAGLASVEKALALNANYAEAHLNKANLCSDLKRYAEALKAYETAIALRTDLADAWLGLGNVHRAMKRPAEATEAYERALVINPAFHEAWLGKGNVLLTEKQLDEALASYDKALALKPDFAEAWQGRGDTMRALERYDEAHSAYNRALALDPRLAPAWVGLGNALLENRRYRDALGSFDSALALNPDLAEAHGGRGMAFAMLQRHGDALAELDRALILQPDYAEAWLARGFTLEMQNDHNGALAAYEQTLALRPDFAEAWVGRGSALFESNRLAEAFAAYDKALSIKPDLASAHSARIFALDFAENCGFEEQQSARRDWWQAVGSRIAARSTVNYPNVRDPDRRIKIGYVSSDLFHTSAATSFKPILINHDKTQFHITCYSCSPVQDGMTATLQQGADQWRDSSQSSDNDLASQIRSDGIDILIDLSGHSGGNRLPVFAARPAPVQVSAWGHAAGTGLLTIDYLFADPVACPPPVRHLFAEKIFDLPCLITAEPLPQDTRPSSLPMLTKGHVTFGVFNRASKVTNPAISLWARILHSLPHSRLLMKSRGFDAQTMRDGLRKKFAVHGISGDRIAFLGNTTRQDHLAAFAEVDLSLDPIPMNGGISTWESLQMGVPVVTKVGNSLASRAGGAIVSAVGLADWVADTADGYLEIAQKFASVPDHLAKLRRELPAMIAASSAGNSVLYTRAVEAAYRKMWTDYCRAG